MEWTRREIWVRKLLYPGHTVPTAGRLLLAYCVLLGIGVAI